MNTEIIEKAQKIHNDVMLKLCQPFFRSRKWFVSNSTTEKGK